MSKSNCCDVAIIGGGLAGLTAANTFLANGVNAQVYEATERLGGRILSIHEDSTGKPSADLGPTWVWPPYQAAVTHWVEQLGLHIFAQHETGDAILDLQPNTPPRRQPLPGQHGIARIAGGPQSFVDGLAGQLEPNQISFGHRLIGIEQIANGFLLNFAGDSTPTVQAQKIVFALPLRLLAEQISWNGLLDETTVELMSATPTWMATQAKVVISYKAGFWKMRGLSGRVASQLGPLAEIHDHTSHDDTYPALFGFVGWPAEQRNAVVLETAIANQLVRCFGPDAAEFTRITIKDWANDPAICSQTDLSTPPAHPAPLPELIRQGFCGNRLAFAVAETGQNHPGLIDGALESGERAARLILSLNAA